MKHSSTHTSRLAYLFASTGLMSAVPAHAQLAAQDGIQEIVVTAQKRSERLSEVPMSITAATGDQLSKQGVSNPTDLEKIVPGFTFQQSSYGTPVFSIRGIGFYDTAIGGSPAVSVYLDEVPLPYSVMTRGVSLDLSRLEALKGPQGTLFGQNSTGGAINYIAAKPTTDLKAGFDLDYGRFNAINIQGFVSGQLAPTLRARVSARHEYMDAWQRGFAPNDTLLGKAPGDKLGKRDFSSGRLLVDWDATEDLTFTLGANGWIDKSDTQAQRFRQFAGQSPMDPFNAPVYAELGALQPIPQSDARLAGWDANQDFSRDDWFYQLSLRGGLDLGAVALTSITSYSRYHEDSLTDVDGTAYNDISNLENGRIESFYQELRLSGEAGKLKWLVGGNYSRDESREQQVNLLGGTNAGIGPFRYNSAEVRNTQLVKTIAGFGSIDYSFTDSLKLQASARYTSQKRDFQGCLGDPGNGQIAAAFSNIFGYSASAGDCLTMAGPTAPTRLPLVVSKLDEDNLSWRASLNWKASQGLLLYANLSKGYKSGSYPSIPAVFASQLEPVSQESLLAYEAGFKLAASRRLTLAGAAFYYDYSDKQVLGSTVVLPFGNLPKLVNVPKSRAYGFELSVQANPTAGLQLSVGGTYVNSRVQRNPATGVTLDLFGQPTSFVGEAFPNTPKWQGVADVEYEFTTRGVSPFVGASLRARSASYGTFGANPEARIDGYAIVDLRAGISGPDDKWRLQIYGRNVFDKYYIVNASRYLDNVTEISGMPATYGVSLSYRY